MFKLLWLVETEGGKWELAVTQSNGMMIRTWRHKETGQTFTTEEEADDDRRAEGAPAAAAPLTIDSWVHCKIGHGDPSRAGQFHSKTRVNGLEHRLVAHVDTGNSADTTMSASMFDVFFPLNRGSSYERQGLRYLGTANIRGVTGHVQTLQKYGGLRVMFDGGRSAKGGRLVFTMDVTRMMNDPANVPGTHGYHDLLVSNRDMKRLLDGFGHTVRVVDYSRFAAAAAAAAARGC